MYVHTKKPQVVTYVLSDIYLKKVANRHGVPLVFWAPNKIAQLFLRATKAAGKKAGCSK